MSDRSDRPAFGDLGRSEPLHLRIAAQISREITKGQLQPGDRLPTENSLAESFSVSRNVIREAIACLRSDGIIESRQGLGAFVVQPELRQTIRIDTEELQEQENARNLFELRAMLETETAGLAAERRSAAQLREVHNALQDMMGAEKWSESGIDADLQFHQKIAQATGNPYVVTFLTYLTHQMRQTIVRVRQEFQLEEIVEITIKEHVAIYDAIASGKPDRARKAMRRHINGAAKRLGAKL